MATMSSKNTRTSPRTRANQLANLSIPGLSKRPAGCGSDAAGIPVMDIAARPAPDFAKPAQSRTIQGETVVVSEAPRFSGGTLSVKQETSRALPGVVIGSDCDIAVFRGV